MRDCFLDGFFAGGALVLFAMLFVGEDACATEWEVDVLITFQHTSDILRTPPEPTQDYLGFGWTFVSPGKKWEFDVSTGIKAIDCTIGFGSYNFACPTQSGTELAVRWYPWRKHRS